MSDHRRRRRQKKTNPWVALFLALLIITIGLEAVFYFTLRPFQFQFRLLSTGEYISGFVLPPDSDLDFVRNITLFMPLGFGLAAIFRYLKVPYKPIFVIVVSFAFLLSLMVESLQIFLIGRTPSVADLVANTLGAAAGFVCFRLWRRRKVVSYRLSDTLNVSPSILIALTLLLVFIAVFSFLFSSW